MPIDRDERVKVSHPDLPHTQKNPPVLTRGNLEDHWRDRGWTLWKPTTKKKEN